MFDTTELGAGSYPQKPEDDKYVEFEAIVLCKIKGTVWAYDMDDAKELIDTFKWDEIDKTDYLEVEEIMSIKEV